MNTSSIILRKRYLAYLGPVLPAVVALAIGCESPRGMVHLHEVEGRSDEEVAVLEYGYPLEILSVDGWDVERRRLYPATKPRRLYLEPGPRKMVARHGAIYLIDEEDPAVVRPAPVLIEAQLEAGARYRLGHRIGPPHEGVEIWVEEID